ncbi:aspartic peptidase domain-containing protein [Ephemerocybe angulata]|uniref:Aspartic peptidase domain-containing protein n=1 Tax=Ephemerocybe angulata TaxID=980116 RepID=A0A8H6HA39_9AGAR|nr:aspartic peptidase domain-containing protein [Tulosesus angulatus]
MEERTSRPCATSVLVASMLVSWLVLLPGCYGAIVEFRRIEQLEGAATGSAAQTGLGKVLAQVDRLGTSGNGTQDNAIANHQDIRYSTNITLGEKSYVVALDTGSTDLWVHPPTGDSLAEWNNTNIPLELRYGDGSYGVKGMIMQAPFRMGSYNVSSQAFLHATSATVKGLSEIGVEGVMGLAFDRSIASPINQAVKAKFGQNTTWGSSVLANIFAGSKNTSNFVAIDLARTDDLEDTAGGSFAIGEYADQWAAVKQAPKLAQYPKGAYRWTTLMDGVAVDGKALNVSSQIDGVPEGSVVVLFDTGDPTALLPTKIQEGIYEKVPGVVSFTQRGVRVWILPCNTTTVVEFTFSGQKYPIHPLDLSTMSKEVAVSGANHTACFSSIGGINNLGGNEFEASLGDIFLRNVYSVYDFGDGPGGEPYMQLLAQTNSSQAVAQVAEIRNRTMTGAPPELPPAELLKKLMDEDPTIHDGKEVDICQVSPPPHDTEAIENLAPREGPTEGSGQTTPVNRDSPVVIALLVVSVVVGFTALAFAVFNYVRIGRLERRPVRAGPHYVTASHGGEGSHWTARGEAGTGEEYQRLATPSLHS